MSRMRVRGSVPWLAISSRFQPAPMPNSNAPAREVVDARDLLGGDDRVALGDQADAACRPAGASSRPAPRRSSRRTGRSVCAYWRGSVAAARERRLAAGRDVRVLGEQSEPCPRSSTSRASSAGPSASCVGKSARPVCMADESRSDRLPGISMDVHSRGTRTPPMLTPDGQEPVVSERERTSMSPSLRRIGVALGAAGALATAAIGCGGSADQTASASQQQGSSRSSRPLPARGRVPRTSARWPPSSASPRRSCSPRCSRRARRRAPRPMTWRRASPRRSALSEAKVQAAMAATRPSGGGQPPQATAQQSQES